jgi:large subunit ribosomal protein L25
MEEIALAVETREAGTKGVARRLRRGGKIPGVFYGPAVAPTPIVVDGKDFRTHVASLEGSHLIRLRSSAAGLRERVALLKETQVHPVSGEILHVDLYEVDLTKRLQVTVPLHFVGKARGTTEGGILQPILRDIQVECLPSDIPPYIEVDVSELAVHEAVHMTDLKMPPNVTAVFEGNDAVVTVLPPTVEEVKPAEAPEEGAPAEAAPAVAPETEPKEG